MDLVFAPSQIESWPIERLRPYGPFPQHEEARETRSRHDRQRPSMRRLSLRWALLMAGMPLPTASQCAIVVSVETITKGRGIHAINRVVKTPKSRRYRMIGGLDFCELRPS